MTLFCAGLSAVVVLTIVRAMIASEPVRPVMVSGPGLPPGTDLLLDNGQILDVGDDGTLDLATPSGKVLRSARTSNVVVPTDNGPYAVPQLGGGCVTVADDPDTAEIGPVGGRAYRTLDNLGYAVVSGARTAWSDGTIRDSCTGKVLETAGPDDFGSPPECLVGSVVLREQGTWAAPRGLEAWQGRERLWQRAGRLNAVCDASGTTALLDDENDTVDLVNPATGKPAWKSPEPAGAIDSAYPSRVFETPGIVILSGPGGTRAFSEKTGQPLWAKNGECALAVRSSPGPAALLGPCAHGDSADGTEASVINPRDGGLVTTLEIGAYDQWTASTRILLAADSSDGAVREVRW